MSNNQYIIKILMHLKVHTKKGLVGFDQTRIYNSLLKETSLTPNQVKEVCNKTVQRIIQTHIKFLSGPHIREIVCSILAECGYGKERLQYTRIGMPYHDIKQLLQEKEQYDKHFRVSSIVLREWKEVKELIEGMTDK